jgi:hypothetical protein
LIADASLLFCCGELVRAESAHRNRRMVLPRLLQIVGRVDVEQHACVLHIHGVRRVAGHQSPGTFVALQGNEFGIKLGTKTHWVAAAAQVLGVDNRVMFKLRRNGPQGVGMNHGHVAWQHQPARGLRARQHAVGDGVPNSLREPPTSGMTTTSLEATVSWAKGAKAAVVTTTTESWLIRA